MSVAEGYRGRDLGEGAQQLKEKGQQPLLKKGPEAF